MIKNKSGQVSDTLTWIVATIIIVLLLIFFIFGSSMLGSTRTVKGNFRDSFISKSSTVNADLFLTKSLIAYHGVEDGNTKKFLDGDLKRLDSQENFKANYSTRKRTFGGVLG